jgi:uncharacterized phage-associated protein
MITLPVSHRERGQLPIDPMSRLFKFDPDKALEVILYIANRAPRPNVYWVLKILYFADKMSLQHWGRFICGDSYVAMSKGPVPSGAYDIVKEVRSGIPMTCPLAGNAFEVKADHRIAPFRDADLDLLSQSDIESLDQSIQDNGHLSFGQLKNKSHDTAFDAAADENDFMPLEDIIATLPNAELVADYLAHRDTVVR